MSAAREVKKKIKRVVGLHGEREVKVLTGPGRGVVLLLDFGGHTPIYLGMYEWELHRFFLETLAGARMVFDVGGHLGYDALMAASAGTCDVVTFEPDLDRAQALRANLARNPGLAPRIDVRTEFIAARSAPGAVTIDEMSAEVGAPDLIKIDIDGGETDALHGAERTLRGARPHLIVETHSPELENDCGVLLAQAGYRPIIKHNRRIWREWRGGAPHNRWLFARGVSNAARPRTAR